ncbi:hypothetical protein F5Y04DRAFT_3691 [Hypomontagnella monticulosa]|nr:hypothetical protein F5Y04DRAFT_3691 [Hypomontagnella monticulosa]
MRRIFGLMVQWLFILLLPSATGLMDIRNSSTALVPIYEPHLSNLPQNPARFNPHLGGQDWTMCCTLAVNESLVIENSTLYIREGQTFFTGTIDSLEEFPRFPCGATFNGTMTAPHQQFWVPYSWCYNRCPGWPMTKINNFEGWLKPMISFILPSLIFCLNIPRRRQLDFPTILFSNMAVELSNVPLVLLKIIIASIIVAADTLLWTCVVLSAASPMIVSGIYEALLDARLLAYLESRTDENSLTARQKAHMLLVVLIGNLDEDAWHSSKLFIENLPEDGARSNNESLQTTTGQTTIEARTSPIAGTGIPNQNHNTGTPNPPRSTTITGRFRQHSYNAEQLKKIVAFKWRLAAMLDSQVSFGSSVGAPVLYYVASFIWSVFEIRERLGSYVTAHQLAAGMFWMTVPHLALISCLLLAGNNPNIWQSAVIDSVLASDDPAVNRISTTDHSTPFIGRMLDHRFALVFKKSMFKPAWMWNRGSNKAKWIAKLGDEYPYLRSMREEVLESRIEMDIWTSSLYGFVLYFIPAFFSGLVSYTTPQTGFGCRSIIILVYGISQLLLQLLWVFRWYFYDRYERGSAEISGHAFAKSTPIKYLWYFLFTFTTFLSALASIGGTIFVLMNVLTNCLCAIPARHWLNLWTSPDALIFVDDATYEQIYYAQMWWFPAGVISVIFMIVVTYIGWWYQRSLRQRFHGLVSKID